MTSMMPERKVNNSFDLNFDVNSSPDLPVNQSDLGIRRRKRPPQEDEESSGGSDVEQFWDNVPRLPADFGLANPSPPDTITRTVKDSNISPFFPINIPKNYFRKPRRSQTVREEPTANVFSLLTHQLNQGYENMWTSAFDLIQPYRDIFKQMMNTVLYATLAFAAISIILIAVAVLSSAIYALLYYLIIPQMHHRWKLHFNYEPTPAYQKRTQQNGAAQPVHIHVWNNRQDASYLSGGAHRTDLGPPTAFVNVLSTHEQWNCIDTSCDHQQPEMKRLLNKNTAYDMYLELVLPESEVNRHIGVTMATVDLLGQSQSPRKTFTKGSREKKAEEKKVCDDSKTCVAEEESSAREVEEHIEESITLASAPHYRQNSMRVLATSRRPIVMQYYSWPVRLLRTAVFSIPLAMGWMTETQHFRILLIDSFVETKTPVIGIRVTLGHPQLQIYDAHLEMAARLKGVRYFMYHWYFSSFAIFTLQIASFLFVCIAILVGWAYFQYLNYESQIVDEVNVMEDEWRQEESDQNQFSEVESSE